ncbi:MAG: hypothetical protein Kow0077_31510 [Anaerolineae bacterium]
MLGYTYHALPPAIGAMPGEGWLAIWVADDAILTRQITPDGALSETRTLLSGVRPWDVRLIAGRANEWHLLWRDFTPVGDAPLFAAHLSPYGELLRGPIQITPDTVSTFAAAPTDGGGAVILWADSHPRTSLYAESLDAQGRPDAQPPVMVARNAEHPTLGRTADGWWVATWLAWPDAPSSDPAARDITLKIGQEALPWEAQTRPVILARISRDSPADIIENTRLGLDPTTGYVFINRYHAETDTRTTMIYPFTLLELTPLPAIDNLTLPETSMFASQTSEQPLPDTQHSDANALVFGSPLAAHGDDMLISAFSAADTLAVTLFRAGAPLEARPLIRTSPAGPATLGISRFGDLAIAWTAQPESHGNPAPVVFSFALAGDNS